ncbi:hypothetical protein SAMN04489796_101307 [Winogradskyella thalassocola]|uniref:Uncharacterized protein n=1 Tax=Winogradskyella thalassocola TaxID=262004 RepID=A0A1G7WB93_9FLAO|nr:hypothetical protein SAMN04489796_101307 [Winogradskyella thalassocola]
MSKQETNPVKKESLKIKGTLDDVLKVSVPKPKQDKDKK